MEANSQTKQENDSVEKTLTNFELNDTSDNLEFVNNDKATEDNTTTVTENSTAAVTSNIPVSETLNKNDGSPCAADENINSEVNEQNTHLASVHITDNTPFPSVPVVTEEEKKPITVSTNETDKLEAQDNNNKSAKAEETTIQTEITQEEIPISLPDALDQCAKDEYLVKTIDWKRKKVRIITQNGTMELCMCVCVYFTDLCIENGPCPLVAISNVLFLRGDLEIQPPDREVVTFEYLVDRLGDYLLSHAPTDKVSI
jgi:hypothetical protein